MQPKDFKACSSQSASIQSSSLQDAIPVVWQYLRPRERRLLRCSCKGLRDAADSQITTITFDEFEICEAGDSSLPFVEKLQLALNSLRGLLARPNVRPTRLKLWSALNTPSDDNGERILLLFGACRSLTAVHLTDKLLTPAAARALVSVAPGLKELHLEHAVECVVRNEDDVDTGTEESRYAHALNVLSTSLPIVLLERAANLTSLRVCSELSLPEAAVSSLAACAGLQELKLSLETPAVKAISSLPSLNFLAMDLPVERISSRLDLAALRSLSALTNLHIATDYQDYPSRGLLAWAMHDDVVGLAGPTRLVSLSLHDAILGAEQLHVLTTSLAVLTSLRVYTIKVAQSPRAPDGGASSREYAAATVKPLSWPLPPALRRLRMEWAEVAALAALQPPESLARVELGPGMDLQPSGLYFEPQRGDDGELRILGGCGSVMRGAVGLLAGRMPVDPFPEAWLNVCLPVQAGYLLGDDQGSHGHTEWLLELQPLGLRRLQLHRIKLGPMDVKALAHAAPNLTELLFTSCHFPPAALLLLRQLMQLRRLHFVHIDTLPVQHYEELRVYLLSLCLGAPALEEVHISFPEGDDSADIMREVVSDWVLQQLGVLGGHEVDIHVQ